ncbi:MAG TPA: hypothetical protein VHF69_14260 [Candidatus Synoicihabitans sp.]|nr:hypothetical protein [Candidatus Synoicihabitans sp.]
MRHYLQFLPTDQTSKALTIGAAMAVLAAAALGVAFSRIHSEERVPAAPERATFDRRATAGTRLLPTELLPNAEVSPMRPGRHARDFIGPESDGPSAPELSAAVPAEDWQAIQAAWRIGDFATAARLTLRLATLDDRRLILRPLLTHWVAAVPEEAAHFALARSAGVERSEMLETTIRAWADRDVAAASAWLDALAPEPDHDGAVAAIATCEVLFQRRPEIALSWAESISAPTLRWEAMCTVAQDWARREAPAAERYVAMSAVLTPAERAEMLTHLRRWAVAVK